MHTQHLQRVRPSGHQLGNRPAYPEACHQTQIFLQAVAFPQDWLHHVQESAPLSQARERPRDHQPFLPVALMFEKRPDLYNTTHGPPVTLPVIRGGSCGAAVSCTAWPVGTIPISLYWLSSAHHFRPCPGSPGAPSSVWSLSVFIPSA